MKTVMNDSLVSIVVPVYNAEKYIEDTVKSLLEQSYSDIEIVLVNDGSKDTSLEICQRLSELDPRIKLFSQENAGVTRARALGVEKASGKWITFVDSDDTLPENAVEILIENCVDFDIVIGQVSYSVPGQWPYPCFDDECDSITAMKYLFKEKIHCGPVAKLINKDLFDKNVFDVPRIITHGEDFIMNIRLFQNASRIRILQCSVYNYIYRNLSVAYQRNPYENISYCRLQEKIILSSIRHENRIVLLPLVARLIVSHRLRWMRLKIKNCLRGFI